MKDIYCSLKIMWFGAGRGTRRLGQVVGLVGGTVRVISIGLTSCCRAVLIGSKIVFWWSTKIGIILTFGSRSIFWILVLMIIRTFIRVAISHSTSDR